MKIEKNNNSGTNRTLIMILNAGSIIILLTHFRGNCCYCYSSSMQLFGVRFDSCSFVIDVPSASIHVITYYRVPRCCHTICDALALRTIRTSMCIVLYILTCCMKFHPCANYQSFEMNAVIAKEQTGNDRTTDKYECLKIVLIYYKHHYTIDDC